MTATDFHIQKISQISIRVHHIDAAVPFYQETLGLKLLFRMSNMAFFECGGIRILLSVPESPQFDHPSSIFYFYVDDIERSYETLQSRGVTFINKPHLIAEMNGIQTWMAFFQDPDLNVHAVTSEISVN